MNAIEFVKENGIEKCKRILDDLTDQGHNGDFYKDLKRLVESHELIEALGGLKASLYLRNHNMLMKEHLPRIKQAIADVENCK